MSNAYRKRVEYDFEVLDETFSIVEIGDDYVVVEETRKNGQEDCHARGVLALGRTKKYDWIEGVDSFLRAYSRFFANGIQDYLNKNGLPDG